MKTVKEYKSFPIQSISGAIHTDINDSIERKFQRELSRIKVTLKEGENPSHVDYVAARVTGYSKAVGELETLLTIAIMELKHRETVNTLHPLKEDQS